jgi:outer membrane lipoprotein carrier protein
LKLRSLWGALGLIASLAQAGGLDDLEHFLQDTRQGSVSFVQTSQGHSNNANASGTFQFQRPGKFRWEYLKPYPQTLVGDGQYLWIWDPDLKQATRRKLKDSLGSTPAAILAGDDHLEKWFILEDGGEHDGLLWANALPRSKEGGFKRVELGFQNHALVRMNLLDNFDHAISIRFGSMQAGSFSADTFHFVLPKGADLLQ